MRKALMPWKIIGYFTYAAGGAAPIITQLTPATFGPYAAGQTPAAVYTAGTYASSAGTISTITPVWTRNGSPATGATVLAAGDVVGLTVTVVDSAANTRGFGYGASSVPYVLPANTVLPTITGTKTQGQTLTSTTGTWTGSPTITYARQWQRGGVNISGATGTTYVLQLADVGSTIKVVVTATNGGGSASASSIATSTIAGLPVAPANTVAPTVTGTPTQGQTLTATAGTWTGTPTITYAYQWQRGVTNISGATSATYVLQAGDVGSTVRVRVTATNGGGSVSADSANTATIAASSSLTVSGVTLSGGKLNMSVSASATMYYLASYSATQMTGAAIKAAVIATTPAVYGSFAYVSPTPVDEAIDLTPMTAGTVYLHVAGDDGTNVVAATPYGFTYTPPAAALSIAQVKSQYQATYPNATLTIPTDFGAAATDRRIVCFVVTDSNTSTFTIAGNAATIHSNTVDSSGYYKYWISAVIASGTSGNIVGAGCTEIYGGSTWAITGNASAFDAATTTAASTSGSIAVKAGGVAVAEHSRTSTTTVTSATWTGLTGDGLPLFDTGSEYYMSASGAFATAQTVTYTCTPSGVTGGVTLSTSAVSFKV